ncbi:hypothetical protein V8D89_004972, partial [Ganoderma adspersum]
ISRVLLIAADLIVIAVTWSALVTGRTVRPGFKGRRHMKLTYVMLEKSLIYVMVMVTMNILHLAFSISSVSTA